MSPAELAKLERALDKATGRVLDLEAGRRAELDRLANDLDAEIERLRAEHIIEHQRLADLKAELGHAIRRAVDAEASLKELAPAAGLEQSDPVHHPSHYTANPSSDALHDVVEHLPFNVGNAIKYLWRAGSKGDAVEDLRKSVWCIEREIQRLGRLA
jgi:Protein of unknwon function (DUF3310)